MYYFNHWIYYNQLSIYYISTKQRAVKSINHIEKRILMIKILEEMKRNPSFSKKLGLVDKSVCTKRNKQIIRKEY